MTSYFENYLFVAAFAGLGVVLVLVMLGVASILRPNKPTAAKKLTYECGVDPVGEGWSQTYVRYYVFGLLFGAATGILFTVMNIIWADYFGRDSIGGIRGMVSPVHMLSNSLGPLAAAMSFDSTGSYFLIFAISAALSAVGGTLLLLARKPRLSGG